MKFFILAIRTESGDECNFLIQGKRKPSEEKIEAFLREEFEEEYNEDFGPGFVNWTINKAEPFEL